MPVMKQLRIGSATYDTVGEASVTQVQTSGTKIATVTIDGTATDLYAPEGGGGGPEPSSTTPAMDGTAAVGTATTYARADHVHPTDTSRQATLVSGTNIKTINGTSLLGSGNITTPTYTLPTASTSTLGGVKVDGSTITIADGVISSSGGGGGGYDYRIDVTIDGSTVTADFNGASLTEIATAVTDDPATNVVIVVVVGSYTTRGIITYSSYDTHWGDIASEIEFVSFFYDNGDNKFFIRRTDLAGRGYSTTKSRCA